MEDYLTWTTRVFGAPIPVPGVLLASSIEPMSEFGSKMHAAMMGVECEFVEQLLSELRQNEVRGAIVEFGIYQGWWINELYQRSEAVGLVDRKIIGYDSFQGLSEPSKDFDSNFWQPGMYAASREEVEGRVQAHERPRIQLIEGWFADSLKSAEAQAVGDIAYARIDCDIYEPALQCLHYLSRRLTDGAILVFDDWPHMNSQGEGLAFAQWVPTVPWLKFEFLMYGSWGHFYVRVRKTDD